MSLSDHKSNGLIGRALWKPQSKRMKVAFNFESAESIHRADKRWPVVGCPNFETFKRNLEYFAGFDEVHMMTPDRDLAERCAMLLPMGVGHIPVLEEEPCDLINAGYGSSVDKAFFDSTPWKPEDILSWGEAVEHVRDAPSVLSYDWPFTHQLNEMTKGMRESEIVLVGGGTGSGKSSFAREAAYHFVTNDGLRVGYIALEEDKREFVGRIGSVALNRPIHLDPDGSLDALKDIPDLNDAFFVCNHPGGLEAVDLFAKIRFMRVGLGCDFVFLDHVSLCTAGREDNNRAQEIVSDGIIKVVQETGVGLVAVAQLRKADTRARAFEEGGAIALADFKGSASLVQAAKTVIGVERDQQGEDRNTASFRVLKNRHAGTTGPAGSVVYEPETARMIDRDVASLVGRMDATVETIDMPPEQEGLTFLNGVDG